MKTLTLRGEQMRSHARKISCGSTPGSGSKPLNNPSPEWQKVDQVKGPEEVPKQDDFARYSLQMKRNRTEERGGEMYDPTAQMFHSIGPPQRKQQVPKNVVIPKFKLPLDKLNEPAGMTFPKPLLAKSSTADDLGNGDYYGHEALYKLKIRKNFRRIQIKNSI